MGNQLFASKDWRNFGKSADLFYQSDKCSRFLLLSISSSMAISKIFDFCLLFASPTGALRKNH
jgi:hypothetical protein